MNPTTTRAVQTHYLGPTDHRGARVVAKILGSGKRFVISWDHVLDTLENHTRAAEVAFGYLHPAPRGDMLVSGVDGGGFVFMVTPTLKSRK